MTCSGCGRDKELRLGFCFDCATAGEARAARRTVGQHIAKGIGHAIRREWTSARICFAWAKERATRTGDYSPGGEFEAQYGIRV